MTSQNETRPLYLAGKKLTTANIKELYSPGAVEPFAKVSFAGPAEIETAIQAAEKAFAITRKLSTGKRAEICRTVAGLIEQNQEIFALDLAREAGKPISLAKGEVLRAALTFNTAADEATRDAGEVLNLDVTPDTEGVMGITKRFPIGPVAAITPFNFPFNLVAHKIAPAIAAGCPIVLKPASATPLSALNIAHLVLQAGWPPEAISVLPCSASDATPLVEDDRFKLITFTGSMTVGWDIKARAGKKRVALELGGNAAAVIDETADLAFAAKRCALGGFAYAGQSCISTQRIYVHWAVKKDFLRLLIEETESLRSGDDLLDAKIMVGPMINEDEAIRVESWVQEAVEQGAHILRGGTRQGARFKKTIMTRISPEMKICSSEIFGPVVVVDTFSSWDEVIEKVNSSEYGLQAGIFTNDLDATFRAFEEVDVGGLVVNDMPTFRIDPQPYGGVKDSGTGREGPRYAIEEMSEQKIMLIRKKIN
jgi:acyl-CoA reductase-like NAD-dependent aldehyde dehydrogenase